MFALYNNHTVCKYMFAAVVNVTLNSALGATLGQRIDAWDGPIVGRTERIETK